MFLFAKTLRTVVTLWRRYDIWKYTADAILFREIQCKKMDKDLGQFPIQSAQILTACG